MSEYKRIGFIIKKKELLFKVGTLFWDPEEMSLYMTLHRDKTSPKGTVGQFNVQRDGSWTIPFKDNVQEERVLHSSVHASGVSHTRLEGSREVGREEGTPLRGLKTPRPLWTIAARISEDTQPIQQAKDDDFIVVEPPELKARVIYMIAMPQGSSEFRVQTFVNEDGSLPSLAWYTFDLGKIGLLVQLHSTDRMIEPERTIKVSSVKNTVPVITSISKTSIEGVYQPFQINQVS